MTLRFVEQADQACADAASLVRALEGWRRIALAFLIGALSALSFAPFGLFPLLLISLAILVLLLDGATSGPHRVWRSALVGWAYGFGQFLVGLYWVAYAFLVDPSGHAWQIPFVAILLPGGLALFIAAACALAARFWWEGTSRIFVLTAAYTLAEWLRGHILTGFPWNLPGYGWAASLPILQSVSVFGVYGLTLLTILFGASLALLAERSPARLVPLALAVLFTGMWAGGAMRLSSTPSYVPGVRLRIVQPNVAQAEKYASALRGRHWQELIDLSRVQHGPPPTHIIWPEAAPPFLLERAPQALADIAAITADNTVLMTGAARAGFGKGGTPVVHNSFYVFAAHAHFLAVYDKFHLVPLGEYVPFQSTLRTLGIDRLVNQPGNFEGGDGPHTFSVPGAPAVAPLICYEVLFPAEVTAPQRPSWFVNVTDDSWFGPETSTGPYQHFLIARVRAIEEGIPIVRAANTGISAIIDPFGRVIAQMPADRVGILDGPLPSALAPPPFARLHHVLFWVMFLGCVGGSFAPRLIFSFRNPTTRSRIVSENLP
ncbi:MAG: apolipoprotein N-acyltransferase [Alphaproteobacteria bacterium]|nr:apolipoprotein N-acyltransferase [Alphaproteobacteria bacterium]